MCDIPEILHPVAESSLWLWLSGDMLDLSFVRVAMLSGSENMGWVMCLIGG